MSSPTNGDGSRGSDAFRMFPASSLTGFQRVGGQTASDVIAGFIDLLGGERAAQPTYRDTDQSIGPEPSFAQFRVDVARALDLYSELVRRSFEGYADLLEQRQRVSRVRVNAGDDEPTGPLTLRGPVDGSPAEGTVWIHNTTDEPASAQLRLTDLTAHDGKVVPSSAGSFEPAAVEIAPGGSVSARLDIVFDGFPPGIYHGHVVAGGLPEAALPIRLAIGPAPGSPL